MPVPYAPPVTLAAADQAVLEPLTRAHTTPQALACRCRLILRAAAPERPSHGRLAAAVPGDRHTVRLWRTRSLAQGLVGLPGTRRTAGCAPARTAPALCPPVTGSMWSRSPPGNRPHVTAQHRAGAWMM